MPINVSDRISSNQNNSVNILSGRVTREKK